MNLRLSRQERGALAFMFLAALGFATSMSGLASRNGWFESKMHFTTTLGTSEGIREGSPVEMAGVRIGSVTAVEFDAENRVRVKLAIRRRFGNRLHADSHIEIFRPFVIGDKTLAVFPGSADQPALADRSEIHSVDVPSLAELLDGRKLVPYLQTFTASMEALKAVADILVRNNRPADFAKGLGELGQTISGLHQVVQTLNRALPVLEAGAPGMGKDVAALVANLASLTTELNKLAPEFPKSSKRVGEALDEAVVVLKAMQKTFLLSSSVREVRKEEADAERQPASDKRDKPH